MLRIKLVVVLLIVVVVARWTVQSVTLILIETL